MTYNIFSFTNTRFHEFMGTKNLITIIVPSTTLKTKAVEFPLQNTVPKNCTSV